MAFLARLKLRARNLKAETYALYLAARDPRTPWYAKVLITCIVAYAFSPIDLIPDFVPVLGYLDDLVLIPMGVAFVIKLVPPHILTECRTRARETIQNKKHRNWIAGVVIIVIWVLAAALCIKWFYEIFI